MKLFLPIRMSTSVSNTFPGIATCTTGLFCSEIREYIFFFRHIETKSSKDFTFLAEMAITLLPQLKNQVTILILF